MRNDLPVGRATRPCVSKVLGSLETWNLRAGRPSHYFLIFVLCALALNAHAQKQIEPASAIVLTPEQAAHQGRALASQILDEKPLENSTNTGVMTIRDTRNRRTRIPIKFEIITAPDKWLSRYQGGTTVATVIHDDAEPNEYQLRAPDGSITTLSANQANAPFAGSDFSIADLGLEFLHWPQQDLTKKEMKRSRSCNVLTSINPHPMPGGYSRVVSWLDIQSTNGIIYAEAFDLQGKKLKEFIPKKVIHGQLAEMEIDNVQTDSRTTVDFNVDEAK